MRKDLALLRKRLALLVLALCVLLLYGCSTDLGTPTGEISDYDSMQFIPVDDNPSETANESTADISDVQVESREPSESHETAESYEHKDYSENVTTQGSGFLVSDKMYDFEGNNLVVLNVENKTNKNYSISIHGQYLDESGKVLKEETKEYRGFEAGWKNNFFFIPEMPFAKFKYKMETKEYSGKCYGSMFSLTYKWERKDAYDFSRGQDAMNEASYNWKDYLVDSLILNIFHNYQSEEEIALKSSVLLLSSQGEVLRSKDLMRRIMEAGDYTGNYVDMAQRKYICSDENNAKLVEQFESGDIVVLISIEVAKLCDEENPWEW